MELPKLKPYPLTVALKRYTQRKGRLDAPLSALDRAVFEAILELGNNKTRICEATNEEIRVVADCQAGAVPRAMRRLEEFALIERVYVGPRGRFPSGRRAPQGGAYTLVRVLDVKDLDRLLRNRDGDRTLVRPDRTRLRSDRTKSAIPSFNALNTSLLNQDPPPPLRIPAQPRERAGEEQKADARDERAPDVAAPSARRAVPTSSARRDVERGERTTSPRAARPTGRDEAAVEEGAARGAVAKPAADGELAASHDELVAMAREVLRYRALRVGRAADSASIPEHEELVLELLAGGKTPVTVVQCKAVVDEFVTGQHTRGKRDRLTVRQMFGDRRRFADALLRAREGGWDGVSDPEAARTPPPRTNSPHKSNGATSGQANQTAGGCVHTPEQAARILREMLDRGDLPSIVEGTRERWSRELGVELVIPERRKR